MNYGRLPPPGAPPIQIRVRGSGTPTSDDLAATNGYLLAFLRAMRLSLGKHHRKILRLPGGGEVRLETIFGTVTVNIYPVGGGSEVESFYGGIVVQLKVYQNEEAYLDDAWLGATRTGAMPRYPTFDSENENYERWAQLDERRIPSYVKFSGQSEAKKGRPAVPGTGEAETEWLIFQIARDLDLNVTPFETGAIKIFRIHEPKIGALVETNDTPGKYLLSANTGSDLPLLPSPAVLNTLSEFYLCGKQVTTIPPLVAPVTPGITSPGLSLRTYGLSFESFESAGIAQGIVIAAVHRGLYALNTVETPRAWKVLDSDPAGFDSSARLNVYGDVFTETNTNGVITISCTGSNGWGVMSGYTVTIAANEQGGPPTITGSLLLMGRAYTSATEVESSGALVYNYLKPDYSVRSWTDQVAVWNPFSDPAAYELIPFDRHWAVLDDQTMTVAGSGSVTYGTPETPYDFFLGGPIPISAPITASGTISRESWWGNSGALREQSEPNGGTSYSMVRDFGMTLSLSVASSGGRFHPLTTFTLDFSADFTGNTLDSPGSWTESGSSIPASISFGEEVEGREGYAGIDLHTNKLAFRYSQGRTGTIYSGVNERPYFIEETPTITSSPYTEYSSWRISLHLLRPDGTTVAGWDDFTTAFSTMLDAFGPVTPGGSTAGTRFSPYIGYVSSMRGIRAMISDWFLEGYPPATPPDVPDTGFWSSVYTFLVDQATVQNYPGGPIDLDLVPAEWSDPDFAGWDITVPGGVDIGPAIVPGFPWAGVGPMANRILRDLRTGGFIAQTYWVGANYSYPDRTDIIWTSLSLNVTKNPIVNETMIGNDVSVVPLKDILNQWMVLGETTHPSIPTLPEVFNKTFIDGDPNLRVMLI